MSKRLPPSQRPERNRDNAPQERWVKVGIVPHAANHSKMGVLIGTGPKDAPTSKTVIAPDEARTLAATDDDPAVAAELRRVADLVDSTLASGHKLSSEISVVSPKITGPEALRDWSMRYAGELRSCYRTALANGWPADVVIWAMPRTESLDDPPAGANPMRLRDARAFVSRNVPTGRGSLDGPPKPGHFYVVASREAGRFKGTFFGMLPVPDPGEELPGSFAVPHPEPENN